MVVQHGCPINRQNPHTGMTPLHWACYHGNMALMELLLSRGADPSLLTVNDEFGKLPIDLAGIDRCYIKAPQLAYRHVCLIVAEYHIQGVSCKLRHQSGSASKRLLMPLGAPVHSLQIIKSS